MDGVDRSVQDIARQVAEWRGSILSAKQCQDLSSKLSKAMGNIQELVSPYEASAAVTFQPALEEFQRIVEEARLQVEVFSKADWLKASVFQIRNEEAFQEILLKVGLCYNVIYEQAKAMALDAKLDINVEDLRNLQNDSPFLPARSEDALEDLSTLRRWLKVTAESSRYTNDVILARYLLRRLSVPDTSEKFSHEDTCIMYDASTLKVSDTDLKQTWDSSTDLLHHSNFSCVYKTKWLDFNAAKKVWFLDEESLAVTDLFRKEAELLASLNHPNIVKFFCCGISTEGHRKQCFIGMELMERTLDDLIKEHRKAGRSFPIHVALDIILQIARGMLYMHESKIAHRDFKPHNVGVSNASNGTICVKLLDFGLSKIKVQVSKSQTPTYDNIGTTRYRAPEAFEEAKAISCKQKVKWFSADVYSFAVTCYQILTLQEPYTSIKNTALYKELMQDTRPPLPDDCSGTLSELVKLVKECWAGDFNARPDFGSICERLEKLKHNLLLQGAGAASTEGVDQLRGENVDSTSSYAFIETMLKRRSELRTRAKHLPNVVENENATSYFDEGHINEGGDVAISKGVDEMEYALVNL